MINTSDAVYTMHTLYLFFSFSFGLAAYRHDKWFAFVLPKHCSLSADNESNLIQVKYKNKKNIQMHHILFDHF